MQPHSENAYRHIAAPLFLPIAAGLLIAQFVATWFVHDSNIDLYKTVQAAQEAGYFVIPAGPVIASLKALKSAILGGLFYTLSIGVGLTLLTWAALQLWMGVLRRNKWVLIAFLVIWAGLVLWINLKGITLFPTLFCVLVPLATATPLIFFSLHRRERHDYLWIAPLSTLLLLTAVWATQLNGNLFTMIRDHILLSNPAGRSVNDFYYRYTLYAAQSFKSLHQNTVRTYTIEPLNDQRLVERISQRMARHGMLYLPKIEQPDFSVAIENDRLVLTSYGGDQISATVDEILAKPTHWLQQLSKASDKYKPLRRITLVGLLIGFPIILYIIVYGVIFTAICTILKKRAATFTTSALCLVIGLLLFFPMIGGRPISISENSISQALAAEQWPQRVAALRYIEKHNIDIGKYPEQYKTLLTSPLVVERYWLARAMASSRSAATYADLRTMLSDPHPNVTCQVYYSLGKRGNRIAIAEIQAQMETSDHWYAQWYGYRALRRLGWYPSPSK